MPVFSVTLDMGVRVLVMFSHFQIEGLFLLVLQDMMQWCVPSKLIPFMLPYLSRSSDS